MCYSMGGKYLPDSPSPGAPQTTVNWPRLLVRPSNGCKQAELIAQHS